MALHHQHEQSQKALRVNAGQPWVCSPSWCRAIGPVQSHTAYVMPCPSQGPE